MTEKFWMKLAWLMPRRLVYWAAIRLWAHDTQGQWSNTVAPELRMDESLKRWAVPHA